MRVKARRKSDQRRRECKLAPLPGTRQSRIGKDGVKATSALAAHAKTANGRDPARGFRRGDRESSDRVALLVSRATRLLEPRLGRFPSLLPATVRRVAEVRARGRAGSAVGHLVAEAHEVTVGATRLLIDAADSRARVRGRGAAAGPGTRRGLRRGLAAATTAGAAGGAALAGAFAGRHWARGCRARERSRPGGVRSTTGGTLSFSNLIIRARTSIPNFAFVKNFFTPT